MRIIETNFSFDSLAKRSKTNRLILHHTAATILTVEQVHSIHKGNGYSGIGYHFYVRKDGSIYRGRPLDCVGAHASGHNSDSVGICFEGNFENENMSDAQKESGKWLVGYLKHMYGISKVQKHSGVNSTACPGKNFPFTELSSATYKENKFEIQAHVQSIGWQNKAGAGEVVGTVGESKRLEAFVINSNEIDFKYRVHCQTLGDGPLLANGQVAGTVGSSKRIEAIWIDADVDIEYCAHIQGKGWTDWKKNGTWCGTKGQAKRIEAIKLRLA